eukprot:TRINITY_DN8079_c0_g2_i2.p1 TRINITY_DN8079_c0_g2~~TRINITY_DN8079_c0_g2_i2.p1  ORF type:complete len:106 (+),score=17.09 TRINITY_DN8079_c0_g2_i2:287-604(+)
MGHTSSYMELCEVDSAEEKLVILGLVRKLPGSRGRGGAAEELSLQVQCPEVLSDDCGVIAGAAVMDSQSLGAETLHAQHGKKCGDLYVLLTMKMAMHDMVSLDRG